MSETFAKFRENNCAANRTVVFYIVETWSMDFLVLKVYDPKK